MDATLQTGEIRGSATERVVFGYPAATAVLGVKAQRRISACMGAPNEPAAAVLEHFVHMLGLPCFLEDVGVARADLPRIAEGTLSDIWGRTNPRPFGGAADVMEILSMALRNESSSPPSRASGVKR